VLHQPRDWLDSVFVKERFELSAKAPNCRIRGYGANQLRGKSVFVPAELISFKDDVNANARYSQEPRDLLKCAFRVASKVVVKKYQALRFGDIAKDPLKLVAQTAHVFVLQRSRRGATFRNIDPAATFLLHSPGEFGRLSIFFEGFQEFVVEGDEQIYGVAHQSDKLRVGPTPENGGNGLNRA
jgi:hypothetical protein